jgi:hypothetical protein
MQTKWQNKENKSLLINDDLYLAVSFLVYKTEVPG